MLLPICFYSTPRVIVKLLENVHHIPECQVARSARPEKMCMIITSAGLHYATNKQICNFLFYFLFQHSMLHPRLHCGSSARVVSWLWIPWWWQHPKDCHHQPTIIEREQWCRNVCSRENQAIYVDLLLHKWNRPCLKFFGISFWQTAYLLSKVFTRWLRALMCLNINLTWWP